MSEHFRSYSAVFPFLTRKDGDSTKILLHRRQNTGYQDGKWDIAGSGHVDEGETAKTAAVRECKEELGIDVNIEDLTFALLSHRLSARIYYDIYFAVERYEGTPDIIEPEKCSALEWFDMDKLPPDIILCRKAAIQAYIDGICYNEIIEDLHD
jgi:8-oxo-dGTP pyrophosphatase MutT (NUDIX family)